MYILLHFNSQVCSVINVNLTTFNKRILFNYQQLEHATDDAASIIRFKSSGSNVVASF